MTLVRHTLLYFAARVLPALIGMAGVAVYTRLLDAASVGLYAVFFGIASMLAVAFNWLRVAAFRLVGSNDQTSPDFARTVVVSFVAVAVLLGIGEYVGLRLAFRSASTVLLLLAVAATISSAWCELTLSVLQARLCVAAYGRTNLLRAVLTLGCSLTLIRMGLTTEALLAGISVGNLAALTAWAQWRSAARGTFRREVLRALVRFGWPSSISVALSQFSGTFDRLYLSAVGGNAAVGIYAVANDFSRQSIFLLVAASALGGQALAMKSLDRQGAAAALDQLRQNARLIFGVAVPSVVGLAAIAPQVVQTFLGARFRLDAAPIIALIAVATALNGVRTFYFDQAFELTRNTRPQALITAASAIVGLGCSLALISRFGALGAAVSATAVNVVGVVMSLRWGRRFLALPIPAGDLTTIGVASALMALSIRAVSAGSPAATLVVQCAVGAAVYGAVLLLFSYRQMRRSARVTPA